MEYVKIKILLEKYFDGESSLEEERALREYFTRNEVVPEEFAYARELFLYFNEESDVRFENSEVVKTKRLQRKYLLRLTGIAASILLIAGVLFYALRPETQVTYAVINGVKITDKEIAIKETRKALLLISDNLNEGTKDLGYLTKLNEVQQLISKNKKP